jgi:hypothetical protein
VPQQDKKQRCIGRVVFFAKLHYSKKIKNNNPLGVVFFLFAELRYNNKKIQ